MQSVMKSFQDFMDDLNNGMKISSLDFHYHPSEQNAISVNIPVFLFESLGGDLFPYLPLVKCDTDTKQFIAELKSSSDNDSKRYLYRELTKGFLLIDIVSFSLFSLKEQLGLIARFGYVVDTGLMGCKKSIEGFVPTGDGFYIVFSDVNGFQEMIPTVLAILSELDSYNSEGVSNTKIRIRVALDIGIVDYFRDKSGKWNYLGPGIIDVERLISRASHQYKDKPNPVIVGKKLADLIPSPKPNFSEIRSFKDKHEIEHCYYFYNRKGVNMSSSKNCPEEKNNLEESDEKFFWDVIKRYDSYFVSINTKYTAIVTFNTVVLTGISLKIKDVLEAYNGNGAMFFLLLASGLIVGLASLASTLFAYMAVYPFKGTAKTSVSDIFFADVVKHGSPGAYIEHFKKNKSDLATDLATQTYHLADGLTKKFNFVSLSIKALGFELAFLAIILISYFFSNIYMFNTNLRA